MSWLWWAQLAADALLIGAVVLLMFKLRSPAGLPKSATPADLERFLGEAGRLGKEFDRLLSEKRELVGTTLATLDARIAQLKQMASELERIQLPASPAPAPPAAPAPQVTPGQENQSFRAQVLALARQGQTVPQIAQATGRPRGEVELVLGLSK